MATGLSNKLVGQTGEYLVAAELSRRGLIATTFTGNVPHYDIIASDESGRHVSVQVKASRGGSWQFNMIPFCEIKFQEKRQIVGSPKNVPVKRLVVVFVTIAEDGNDHFFICTWQRLRDILIKQHTSYLKKHNGIRPKRWDSMHNAISEKALLRYKDKWDTIERNLR